MDRASSEEEKERELVLSHVSAHSYASREDAECELSVGWLLPYMSQIGHGISTTARYTALSPLRVIVSSKCGITALIRRYPNIYTLYNL